MTFDGVLLALVLACTGYLVLLYSLYFSLMVLVHVESRRRRRERSVDDPDALAASRFAPGVSIIVPCVQRERRPSGRRAVRSTIRSSR